VPTASKQSINGRHGMTVTLLTVNMYMFPSHCGDCKHTAYILSSFLDT